MPKFLRKPVRECPVEIPLVVEQPHAPSAFPRFHHQLPGARVQPAMALFEQLLDRIRGKRSGMLLT